MTKIRNILLIKIAFSAVDDLDTVFPKRVVFLLCRCFTQVFNETENYSVTKLCEASNLLLQSAKLEPVVILLTLFEGKQGGRTKTVKLHWHQDWISTALSVINFTNV